ncbi:hypothetical protein IAT38_003967 [Cryptococcus sp. DSM 104549]
MPRVGRAKVRHHTSAVALPSKAKAPEPEPEPVMEEEEEEETYQPAPVEDLRKGKKQRQLKLPPPTPGMSGQAPHPYFIPSKSHLRREKRKARNIASGLDSLESALDSVFQEEPLQQVISGEKGAKKRVKTKEERDEERRKALEKQVEMGKIGEGRGRTLGEKKRRQVIQESAKRIPAVMAHPAYKQNPWAAIREHVGNTVAVKDKDLGKRKK